jgi:hypothetical protein
VGPVSEETGPNFYHPLYGEAARPVRGGGTIDGRDIEQRASYCMNLKASSGYSADDKRESEKTKSETVNEN